ncbi:Vs.1 conserved transglycosylase SLT domain protein [Aeromonas phage 65]|uniref:Transglycosylase SLT domain-containing protein n=2 Tax=Ishigurovirus osborne TaxID=260149 RepID=A0A219YDI6_9CAUD|nr:hypothetical protein ST65p420 [Aeromonas phage 65]ADQ53426.1 Vs.1 conserved transglycosylase SLT domain protein [Aeromonas phage 65]APU01783.1 hypothetical protein [Aeromonas phage 65.2]
MKSGSILVGILLLLTSISANAVMYENRELTENQIYTIQRAYELGESSGYGLTLAAIALTESKAGKFLINNRTGDYGVFQNNLKYTVKRVEQLTGSKMGWKHQRKLRSELIASMETSANYALMELEYWKEVRNGDWKMVVKSYNAGYSPNSSAGIEYYERVAKNIKFLRSCGCYRQ